MLGYLANAELGARPYNLVHTDALPLALSGVSWPSAVRTAGVRAHLAGAHRWGSCARLRAARSDSVSMSSGGRREGALFGAVSVRAPLRGVVWLHWQNASREDCVCQAWTSAEKDRPDGAGTSDSRSLGTLKI